MGSVPTREHVHAAALCEGVAVPRIEAPTVAEHHLMRKTALIQAGKDILMTRGFEAVTPASVGSAAGIARSSVYQYFPSTTALLIAILDEAFPQATARLTTAVTRREDPREQVDLYLSAAFDFATDAEHRMFDAFPAEGLPIEVKDRLDALHHDQYMPLIEALTRLGVADISMSAHFISGLLQAAVRAVKAGAEPATVKAALLKAVKSGPLA